jgi:hypothetical protein
MMMMYSYIAKIEKLRRPFNTRKGPWLSHQRAEISVSHQSCNERSDEVVSLSTRIRPQGDIAQGLGCGDKGLQTLGLRRTLLSAHARRYYASCGGG